MAWPYLPVNPECLANPCTTCSTCATTSDLLTYAGPNLSATGIEACDTLSVSLQKIDALLVTIVANIAALDVRITALEP